MKIELPWPPKELSPNARLHWARLARAKKEYRHDCAWAAILQGVKRARTEKLHLSLTFFAPTRRAYDLDNALARMKAGLARWAGKCCFSPAFRSLRIPPTLSAPISFFASLKLVLARLT